MSFNMCLRPLYLHKKDPATGSFIERVVPCGVCPECLKKRQSGIVVRTLIESAKRPSCWFFTLTYNEDRLPLVDGVPSLRREDLKNWKKDFRKIISCDDFSWLCCGEYGPKTQRPHYHGLIFGLDDRDIKIADESWYSKYGFTVFKKIPLLSCSDDIGRVARYVAKYIVKDGDFKVPNSSVESPRLMTSVGFGCPDSRFVDWLLCRDRFDYDPFDKSTITHQIVLSVSERMYFPYKGFRYSIPLYILRKLLYEKNFKGNLESSPLLKMVGAIVRIRAKIDDYQEFEEFVNSNSEREIGEILALYTSCKENYISEKFDSKRKDYLSTYKNALV